MNEEQKRLEMALLRAIEGEAGKSAISDNSKIPEMANALIDLWAATGQFPKETQTVLRNESISVDIPNCNCNDLVKKYREARKVNGSAVFV